MAAPSPVQSNFQCECIRHQKLNTQLTHIYKFIQLHAALTLPNCRLKRERELVGKDIRVSEAPQSHRGQPVVCLVYTVTVSSQSTHNISYGHATSLVWMQQSLGVTAHLFQVGGQNYRSELHSMHAQRQSGL